MTNEQALRIAEQIKAVVPYRAMTRFHIACALNRWARKETPEKAAYHREIETIKEGLDMTVNAIAEHWDGDGSYQRGVAQIAKALAAL